MDEKGWIPVSLIASFNRIRQLTMDVHLVRDVLSLSSVVQVKGDWVRMSDWEQFVLPNATVSEVEKLDYEPTETFAKSFQEKGGHVGLHSGDLLGADAGRDGEHNEGLKEDGEEEDCEDEDDDDVVFVMNHDEDGQPWPPERFTSS
jgi:la-related protein 1